MSANQIHTHPAGKTPDALRICTCCGAVPYAGDAYCAGCGERLLREPPGRARSACGACGAGVTHPVALFCTRCGAPLGDRATSMMRPLGGAPPG